MSRGEILVYLVGKLLGAAVLAAFLVVGRQAYEFRVVQKSSEYANRQVLFEQAVERGCSVVSENIICPPTVHGAPIREMKPFRHALATKKQLQEMED